MDITLFAICASIHYFYISNLYTILKLKYYSLKK